MNNNPYHDFRAAECCLNCKFRKSRIDKNVLCEAYERPEDGNTAWMPERGWCNKYERTTSKAILRAEQTLVDRMLKYTAK